MAWFPPPPALTVRGEFSHAANPDGNAEMVVVETSAKNATTMMSSAATLAGTTNAGVLVAAANRVPIDPNTGGPPAPPTGGGLMIRVPSRDLGTGGLVAARKGKGMPYPPW